MIAPPISAGSRAIVLTEVTEMGGAERSCLALANWLHKRGVPAHFVTYQDKVGLERFATHPLPIVQLQPAMTPLHKVLALRRYFSALPQDPRPLMSGYQPALHATLAGMRGFHCLMHDTPSLFSDARISQSFRARLGRRVSDAITGYGLRSGGTTIVTSSYLRAETLHVFGVDPAIARMGGMTQPDSFNLRPITRTLRMVSVSRIESNKRIDWIVRALATLESATIPLSTQINWRLDVAGKGSALEAMRTLAQQLGVADRICFHGFVTDARLQQLYDAADLFLMPAVQGYGIPAIESLARGIPVLLHRESGVSDILLDTPWATVLSGGEDSMQGALSTAIESVRTGRHVASPLPPLPTEDSWAAEVCSLCHWI